MLPAVIVKGDPTWTMQERMQHYKVPGVSIAVMENFKIAWSKAYGLSDAETKEPVTLETLFQAGSISKPVAAMVALKKVEKGRLTLDENINNKLASWKLPDNEFTANKKVTLANLLSHTAGLTVHGFPGYAVGEKLPALPQVLDGVEPANTAAVRVDMAPGAKFRYSGGGTTIMQLAVMDIEKKPFPQIAKETVLAPLEMTNSTYEQPLPPDWLQRAAAGYRGDGSEVEGKRHIKDAPIQYGFLKTPDGKIDTVKISSQGSTSLAPRLSQDFMIPHDHLLAGHFDAAIEAYRKIKQEQPNNVAVEEGRINNLGYEFLRQNMRSLWS